MNKEYEEYLYKEYPLLYADKDKPMSETSMCFGFDGCPNRWYFSLGALSYILEVLIEDYIEQNPYGEVPRASQVKNKFGQLRFYMKNGTPLMYKFIRKTEEEIKKHEEQDQEE